jgi:integrase/recombinase XerD
MTDPTAPAHLTRDLPLKPAIAGWQIYLADQGKSPHTVKAFAADVRLLAKFLPKDQPLGDTTTDQLNQFLEWLQNGRGVPCSPKSLARRITSIKAFFRWLQAGGILLADPAERVVQRSVISPLPQVLSPAEVTAALAAADRFRSADRPDHRAYALFTLLLETGLKKSETLTLAPEHLDFEAPAGPTLFVRYNSPANRYKERKIALTPDWAETYARYIAAHPIEDRVFPWSPRRLEYLLEDITNEAGLDKHISFAMCRWTCALTDLRAGVDPNHIRQKLGISKIQWREISMKLNKLNQSTPADG